MNPALADHVVARLRRTLPKAYVVRGSTPVLSFGDASVAEVATLGFNPSRREFLHQNGHELGGMDRRFETLASLGVPSLAEAAKGLLHRVVNACNGYFHANPYRRWFDQLEPILKSVGASYYNGSACHLDLVQWATDPVWGKIPRARQDLMLSEDAEFLRTQLTTGSFRLLLINGRGVARRFERMMNISLLSAESVKGSTVESSVFMGRLPLGTRVIAWSVNIQSSHGVCSTLRANIAEHIRQLNRS